MPTISGSSSTTRTKISSISGLVGFVELMKSHPRAVVEHRELVLMCLSDDDVTIRTRALELLTGMVTRKTLEDLVLKLLARETGRRRP